MTSQWITLSSMLSALAAAVGSGGRARRYDGSSVQAMATEFILAYEDQDRGKHTGCGGRCLPCGSLLIVALVVIHAPFPQEEAVLPGYTRAAAGIGPGVDLHRRLVGPRSMDRASYARHVLECVRQHAAWAAPVVCARAFGESLACIALVLPAWVALVGIGALISARGIHGWPIWMAGAFGAALGDWRSSWIGQQLADTVAHLWPLSRHPALIPKGEAFVKRWGVASIFIGRCFGPLRASVPLVAGIFAMPYWRFVEVHRAARGGVLHGERWRS